MRKPSLMCRFEDNASESRRTQSHWRMLAMIRQGEGALATVLRWYFNKPIRPMALGNAHESAASNFSSREWERVMVDLVVTYWIRLISALIAGGPAGLKAAEDARRAAE